MIIEASTTQLGVIMTSRQKLIDHLANLKCARSEAFAEGDWDRVDYIGECISETQNELTKLAKKLPKHQ